MLLCYFCHFFCCNFLNFNTKDEANFNGNGESMQFLGTMYLYNMTPRNDAVSALQVVGQNLC